MARDPAKRSAISAFVVETGWPGVAVTHRCRFMGSGAGQRRAHLPRRARAAREPHGAEGKGLKVALTTLNTGRLALPAATGGWPSAACRCADLGPGAAPVGRAHRVARGGRPQDRRHRRHHLRHGGGQRPRRRHERLAGLRHPLEAAAAKEWNTVQAWRIVDDTLQVRGGAASRPRSRSRRAARRRWAWSAAARLAHQPHLRGLERDHAPVHGPRGRGQAPAGRGALIDPERRDERWAALPRVAAFYGRWYPTRWLGWGAGPASRTSARWPPTCASWSG
jgi:hypothetical protein